MDQLDVCTDKNVCNSKSTLKMQGFSIVETGLLHSFKIELKMLGPSI